MGAARLFAESGQVLQGAAGIACERVKQAHLDIGVRIEHRDLFIAIAFVDIIEQQAYTYTTICRFQ